MTLRANGVTSPPAIELLMPKSQPTKMVVFGRATFVAPAISEVGLDVTGVEVVKSGMPLLETSPESRKG